MDAFVFPSETDTFGNVVLEAMASGVPPIVAAGGGPKYLVRSGVNGFQAASPHEIVFAILKLQHDPAWRRELVANARQAVMQFSWSSVFEAFTGSTSGLRRRTYFCARCVLPGKIRLRIPLPDPAHSREQRVILVRSQKQWRFVLIADLV